MIKKGLIIRLIWILFVISGCFYLYEIQFLERLRTHSKIRQLVGLPRIYVAPKEYSDVVELANDLREYAATGSDTLEQQLFPWWLHTGNGGTSQQYYSQSDTSKGIVISTGDRHFRLTLVALASLEFIGNELPIEVVFCGYKDLSPPNRQKLEGLFPKVRLIDMSSTSLNNSYLNLRGWDTKPFAALVSRFREVLLMDSDSLFLEKPSTLFQNPLYLKTGTLFFHDRVNFDDNTIKWMRTLSTAKNNDSIPRHTQESGVILIDKGRVLKGLLSICKLNDDKERDTFIYPRLHGDKDTWWLGLHIIETPYSMVPTPTASIGYAQNMSENHVVCGHILHLDENERPVWWNGAMFRNRYLSDKILLSIEGWLIEGSWSVTYYSCLTNRNQEMKQFSKEHMHLIEGYRQITKQFYNIT